MHAITPQDEQKILKQLGYPNYARNRDHGTSPALYAKTMGLGLTDIAAFEARYQRERQLNAALATISKPSPAVQWMLDQAAAQHRVRGQL